MFQFLFGVAFGAAGYWAWQSFGRDLMGMGGDQGESTYGGFSSSSPTSTTYGSDTPSSTTSPGSTGSTTSASGSTGYTGGSTTGASSS